MEAVKTYPNLGKQNRFLGLELYDWGILLLAYAVVFIVSFNFFLNASVLTFLYFLLFLFKRKKPSGFTGSLIRFLSLEKLYSVESERSWKS